MFCIIVNMLPSIVFDNNFNHRNFLFIIYSVKSLSVVGHFNLHFDRLLIKKAMYFILDFDLELLT